MPKINFSFMTKMTSLVVVLILLTAVTMGWTIFSQARNLLVENQLRELGSAVEINSVRLVSDVEALRNDTIFISNLPEVNGVRRAIQAGGVDPVDLTTDAMWRTQLIDIFSEMLVSKPHYVSLQYIANEDALELVHVQRTDNSVRVLGRRELQIGVENDYFVRALSMESGAVYLSDIELERESENGELIDPQTIVMYSSTPIYSEDGSIFGVVVIGINFGNVFDELLAYKTQSETLYVTNQTGDFLLNSTDPTLTFGFETGQEFRIQNNFEYLTPLFEPSSTLNELPASPDTNSNLVALHFQKVSFDPLAPDRYLGVAVATPYSEIVGAIDSFIQQGILITSALVVTGIVIAIFVARYLIRPLYQITDATKQISEGHLDINLNIHSNDEFGQLAAGFNQMAEAVQEREKELIVVNQTLERRVEERTVELKLARDEALAAQRIAQENSRLKSEFLSMMSHELRTPMNAIEGFTGIILKRMAGTDFNAKTERYLNKIQSNSRRLLSLINDFLDLSRIESGRLELAYLPMSPAQMAQKWQENLSVLADNKGLGFEVKVDPNLPETIYGDEESISKIAINLVGNAIKFTEKGEIELTLEKQGEMMVLQVRDTGIGIPPHAREFIFDEFRQVDQSSKRKYGGTGLGLSIVQKLAREMGGTVTLQSEVGVGSKFIVLLPMNVEEHIEYEVG